jgi:uncharacterized protein YbaP (TraB family)
MMPPIRARDVFQYLLNYLTSFLGETAGMKTRFSSGFVDRASEVSLRFLGWLNIMFLVAFYLALLFATAGAQAREPDTCTARDLIAQMAVDDPAALSQLRQKAASVANGNALLWRVEKDGVAPSYLFGTMHMSDPRAVALPPAAQSAFEQSSTLVIETTEILDQSKMMAAMLANPELMMFTDGTTLYSLLSAEDRAQVEAALTQRGIPPASVAKMKPWMIASMIALPACELARKSAGVPVLDIELAKQAESAGKTLAGLETIADQLGAMASLPMDYHMRGLVETLKLGRRIDDVIETMILLYIRGEPGMFWPFFQAVLPSGEDGEAGFSMFEETMVTARNHTMAREATSYFDKGEAFVAVGALHLPGEEGVVELLRRAGYRLQAVATEKPPIVGGDADAHGCRASAGYSWCEKTGQCERPWELAQSQAFENTREAFVLYCAAK